MKLCEECGVNPANIHLTQIMQNETHVFHLCEECARKKGIAITVNEDVVLGVQENVQNMPEDKTCTRCGMKLSDFRNRGWLGCPSCYQSFDEEIEELLVKVHGSSLHIGKKYSGMLTESDPGDLKRLRLELAMAIKNEEFEQAAALRDAIHGMKQIGVE
jgi:protein arginine kinase activator